MNKAEKIHFRQFCLFSSKSSKANYLLLYNAIIKQAKYNEVDLRKKFKNISDSYFSYEKNNLYNQISRSMVIYHRKKSREAELSEMIQIAVILRKKSLLDESIKILNKAEKLAEGLELFPQLDFIYRMKRKILTIGTRQINYETIKELRLKDQRVIDIQRNLMEYELFAYKTYIANTHRSRQHLGVDNLLQNKLLKNEKYPKSLRAMRYYYHSLQELHCIKGDFRLGAEISDKLIALLESNPAFIEAYPSMYFNALGGSLIAYCHFEEYNSILGMYNLYKNKLSDARFNLSRGFIAKRKCMFLVTVTHAIIMRKSHEAIDDFLESIQALYEEFPKELERMMKFGLCANTALCLIVLERFNEALLWLNRIMNDKRLDSLKGEFHFVVRIMALISHFELENYQVAEYILDSSKRFLKKREMYFDLEEICVKHFRLLFAGNYRKKELDDWFIQFQLELTNSGPRSSEVNSQISDELMPLVGAWVKNKVTNVPISKLIKQKL